ncbi:MAG: hypothetical protein COV98_01665 [Candidatus Altarchaeum sp. CG12_big_fil_rev_8_21_14_0_65_33_22]|nr:MAG: hypothetical protein COV98_01665 [Candidatus Altarchaeum sp. CG12_big_fil_rev_8_21_14_0_65_33_22]
MVKRKVDVLSLTMMSTGRDVEIVIPILYYCEKVLGLSTFSGSGVDGRYWLNKINPKLLLVPNSVGDNNYIKAVKYAAKRNIPVLSLTSEGDFDEKKIHEMVWGINKDKIMYEDLTLQWSERSRKLTFKYYPELTDKIGVSGGVGFDRYKIYKFMSRDKFIKKYKKDYKKIICIAGWGFDQLFGDLFEMDKESILKIYGEEQIKNFKEDRLLVNKILKKLIQNNKDILFILKYHPGMYKIKKNTEFVDLYKYNNIIEIQHEENIADCICGSDFLIAYESTSAMEAWLLDKQTFLINPTITNFPRSDISKGSPIFKKYEECQKAIDNFYTVGKIPWFEEKDEIRKEIIKNIIEWDDGKNHIRVGKIIKEFLEKTRNRKIKKTNLINYLKHYIIHIIFEKTRFITKYSFISKIPIKKLRVLKYCHEIYYHNRFEALKIKYYLYLDIFYDKRHIN